MQCILFDSSLRFMKNSPNCPVLTQQFNVSPWWTNSGLKLKTAQENRPLLTRSTRCFCPKWMDLFKTLFCVTRESYMCFCGPPSSYYHPISISFQKKWYATKHEVVTAFKLQYLSLLPALGREENSLRFVLISVFSNLTIAAK